MYKYFLLYALAFFVSLTVTAAAEKKLIPILKEKAKQPIYEGGPKWHSVKSGTPTMGGLGFLFAIGITTVIAVLYLSLIGEAESGASLALLFLYAAANSLIGVIDDSAKLKRKENAGLSPAQKLLLQLIPAVLFVTARRIVLDAPTSLSFYFGEVELGALYYPLSILLLLGIVNFANLTDGIDGIASCVAFAVGISFFYISAYLDASVGVISSAMIGAAMGFLLFNLHPAKIFMGDTGSLFFGALAVGAAFSLGNPFLIIPIGGVYILEGFSVIIQVLFYKLTKKRVFKMAPIHHHFEKCGFSENKICIGAILLTVLFSVAAYILYLP